MTNNRKIFKDMRSFVTLLLAVAMMCGYFTTAWAAPKASMENKIEILKFLDIAPDTMDTESFVTNETVSRAEYAQYMVKFLNITQEPSGKLYFNDIPKTHYAYDEITVLTDLGYFRGVGQKSFDPEGAMKTQYVYNAMISAMGGGALVEANGADSDYAQKLCAQMGISGGVSGGDDLTLGALYTMMYNALMTNCFGVGGTINEIKESDKTLLYVTRGMKYVKKGTVTAVGEIDIYGENKSDDVMIIDGVEYDLPDFDATSYIGKKVGFIYIDDEDLYDTEGKIVWVKASESDNSIEIEVDPDCVYNEVSGKLMYEEDGRSKHVMIPESIVMIYNGQFLDSGIKDVLKHKRYDITLMKVSGSEYDLAIVNEYENITVNYKNAGDMMIFGKNSGESLSLDPEDYEELKIVNSSGAAMDFASIAANSVVSVYKTADGKKVKAVVSAEQVSGALTSVDGYIMELDGEEYEFYNIETDVKTYFGKNIILYLDAKGYVAYIAPGDIGNSFVGFLIKGRLTEEDDGSGTIMLRILKEDGLIENFFSAEKIRINDTTFKGAPEAAFEVISNDGVNAQPQMVKVVLNDDNKVKKLSTAFEDDGMAHDLIISKRIVAEDGKDVSDYAYHTKGGGRIGKIMAMGTNTKIFKVPEDSAISGADDKYFSVSGSLAEGSYPNAISYRTKLEADFMEEYILIRSNASSFKLGDYPVMLDKAEYVVNSDDEIVQRVRYYSNGGQVSEIDVDKDLDFMSYGLKRGDLFRIAKNDMTGELANIEVTYQPSKDIVKTVGDLTSEYRILYGYVNDVAAEGITLGYTSGATVDEVMNMQTPGIYTAVVYDREEDEIIVSDYSAIKPYKTYGNACSEVVAMTWYTAFRGMFVYR